MNRPWFVIGLLGILLIFSACARQGAYGQGYYKGQNARWHAGYHSVRRGETLYSVAWQYGYDFRQVARWNGISVPYTIYPGQRIRLVPRQGKQVRTPDEHNISKRSPSASKRNQISRSLPYKNAKPPRNKVAQKIRWQWPTRGKIVGAFSAKGGGKKGLDIAGRAGQPIYAAAAGRVVYSGSGLRGYGELIIIKHDETYFSAYAHNKKLRVKENEKVKIGQWIADMGNTGAVRNMLHFEIRRDGTPVSPLRFLPKRQS